MTTNDLAFFIISDIHGDLIALKQIAAKVKDEKNAATLILGDIVPSSMEFAIILKNLPSQHMVRGNCDNLWDFSNFGLSYPQIKLELPFGKRNIIMTHGHYYDASDYSSILNEKDIFLSGHTHYPVMEKGENGKPNILNPGSISRNRKYNKGTYIRLYQDRAELLTLSDKILESLTLSEL